MPSVQSAKPSAASNKARAGLDTKRKKHTPSNPFSPSASQSLFPSNPKAARRRPTDTKRSSSVPLAAGDIESARSAYKRSATEALSEDELESSGNDLVNGLTVLHSHASGHAAVRNGSKYSSPESSPEPLMNTLGSPDGDPFNVAPLPSDARSRELLSLYVGTEAFTTAAVQGLPEGQRFETNMRRERWFPMALKSRAGYAGLVAYLESDRSNPLRPLTEVYRRQYLSIGFQELAVSLKDPNKALADETAFAVLMLLMVSLQLRDFESVRFHAQGLYRLVAQRAEASDKPVWPMQGRGRSGYEDTGIPPLLKYGHIRRPFADILRCNLILSQYTSAFSRDYVAGFGTGHHIWKQADMPKDMNSIEAAMMTTYRIYIRRVATANPLIVTPQVLTAHLMSCLKRCRLEQIWSTTPHVLMWMALMAGPASEGKVHDFFVWVLKETQARTFSWSYQAAAQQTAQLFFWSPVLNTATEQYWDRIISTSQMPSPYEEVNLPCEDALDRPLTLQGDVALRGPAARLSPHPSDGR